MINQIYPWAKKLLFALDAERAHDIGMAGLRLSEKCGVLDKLLPKLAGDAVEEIKLMGLSFPNRIGLAAGLDKEGNTIDALGRVGFGFIEIGTITPRPQSGNPQRRLFRLLEHEAIINRMGFNNPGIEEGVRNVKAQRSFQGVIGFNIGKNKDTPNEDAVDDYVTCYERAYEVADYVAVNLSSPNTPGLRDLQAADATKKLLDRLKESQAEMTQRSGNKVPLLFKVAPDLEEQQIVELAAVFRDGGLDGLIATNTTLDRSQVLGHSLAEQAGGLSGRPVFQKSNEVLRSFSELFKKEIPIIGVGGICSREDAEEKFRAGADLVQIYTSLIYKGPSLVSELKHASTKSPESFQ